MSSVFYDQAEELSELFEQELGLTTGISFSVVNEQALAYAKERAAELVGKKWVGGELVDNPDAHWAITDTTRNQLQGLVSAAFEQGFTPAQLTAQVEESGVFSSARADMIASTEMARAQIKGALYTAGQVGVVGKSSEVSGDHDQDDECDEAEDDGVIAIDDNFTPGDDGPPYHPNCNCALVFYTKDDPEAADLVDDEE